MYDSFSMSVDHLREQAKSPAGEELSDDFNRILQKPDLGPIITGAREDYLNIFVPLFKGSITGDWSSANAILEKRPELVGSSISENFVTPLHVAALAAEETSHTVNFVNNLVSKMTDEELELDTLAGHIALYLAVASSKMKMVEILVKRNVNLMNIPGKDGYLPLHIGAHYARRDKVTYLYTASQKLTGECWTPLQRSRLLDMCVDSDLFDVALAIVNDQPETAPSISVLRRLAQKPEALNERKKVKFIQRIQNSIIRMTHMKMAAEFSKEEDTNDAIKLLKHVLTEFIKTKTWKTVGHYITVDPVDPEMLFVAAEMGNTRFLVELIRSNHDLIWKKNRDGHTIFHIAVINRHQGIHNLLYDIWLLNAMIVSLVDSDGNNMLHLVGKTSVKMRSKTTHASLLTQRELLWFKEVENLLPPSMKGKKNNVGQTPYELFSDENENLVSQGLKWMRDCMVVATLIVTIAFAVAFTVPGGFDQNHGLPIFIHKRSFIVFVIADTISLVYSTTSLLVFLSILTSRYKQLDFLKSLPKKLLIGLATLIISVAAMMVTFCASFFVLYHKGLKWVPIVVVIFAVTPVIIYAALQAPLVVDMFRSMYDSSYLFKPKKRVLFIPNPTVYLSMYQYICYLV